MRKKGKNMDRFSYADKGDRLTEKLILSEYDPVYWEKSEERLLEKAKAFLAEHFGTDGLGKLDMLDLGCGTGRLIPVFSPVAGSVTALEPDSERCEEAKALTEEKRINNAQVYCDDLAGFLETHPDAVFRAVLISHIFQHISRDTVRDILKLLREHTTEDAVIIMTTTFTASEESGFTVESFENGERRCEMTDLDGFERTVSEGKNLPVCLFSRNDMTELLSEAGFYVRSFSPYHFSGETDEMNDERNGQDPERLSSARDAMYICLRKDAGEELPKIDGKISFMQFYSMRSREDTESLLSALKGTTVPGEVPQELKDVYTAEGFLFGGGLHFPAKRFIPGKYDISFGELPVSASHVIVSVYPDSYICQITVCLTLTGADPRDIIWLHQIQTSPAAAFSVNGEIMSIPALCENILSGLGQGGTPRASNSIIIEINRMGDREEAGGLSGDDCRLLYGMLSGDEGWRYVPEAMARERISRSWTSRSFVRAVAFEANFLILNLNRSASYRKYIETQHSFSDPRYGGLNEYFTMDPATAGIAHGFFFSVETGMLIRTITDRLMDRRPDISKPTGIIISDEIRRNKRYRAEMIRTLSRVQKLDISELGELDALVIGGLSVSNRIESLRHLLDLLEGDLDLMYQTSTNRLVNILTAIGLILAGIQTIMTFF